MRKNGFVLRSILLNLHKYHKAALFSLYFQNFAEQTFSANSCAAAENSSLSAMGSKNEEGVKMTDAAKVKKEEGGWR